MLQIASTHLHCTVVAYSDMLYYYCNNVIQVITSGDESIVSEQNL